MDDRQQLLYRVQTWVSGHSHARLVALPELIVLLHLDVERGAPLEAGVAGFAVKVEPQVARLKVRAVLAARAAHRQHSRCEAVQPAAEELYARRSAAVHAGAGRVRGGR